MTSVLLPVRLVIVWLGMMAFGLEAWSADWPQWGGTPGKNMMADEKGLPDSFEPGQKDTRTGTINLATTTNVKWGRKVGSQIYSTPVVAGGKVFLCGGGDDKAGIIACLDEKTGNLLWRWCGGRQTNSFGICSTPVVDGDRLYVVDMNCVVRCLDTNGQPDGPSAGVRTCGPRWNWL